MYTDIGKKIKALAKFMFIIPSIVIALIVLVAMVQIDDDLGIVFLLVGVVMILFNWILSWFLYGFGELIDKTSEIERHLNPNKKTNSSKSKTTAPSSARTERADSPEARYTKLVSLRAQGLITEEEFQNAVNEME